MVQIIRPKNLLLMALLQCFVLLKLGAYNYLFYDIFKTIILLSSTVLIAAGGYIINDYFDVKIDLVNKPQQVVIGNFLSRRWAIIYHIVFTVLGILCAAYISVGTLGIAVLCTVLLYLYSSSFKKKFLVGNIIIAFLAALSVIICKTYIKDLDNTKIAVYSVFAALSTLLREIVKDVEDEKGDTLFQSHSLAISLGLRRTKKILLLIVMVLLVGVIAYIAVVNLSSLMPELYFWTYTLFLVAGVVVPLLYFIFKLLKAEKQNDFAQLSRLLKIIMLIGILSILLS
ncbi:MAG: geranylgeranylglycerol-phosphate geranylgeranyltransferase [Bacteroidetes bacterium]|nr:geranylgeranylglycerol-phosphate geranylgeranyltransferase [Bacteroidota bacterium]